jgi:hypothetical protein
VLEASVAQKEAKLAQKNEVIAKLMKENVRAKKDRWGTTNTTARFRATLGLRNGTEGYSTKMSCVTHRGSSASPRLRGSRPP